MPHSTPILLAVIAVLCAVVAVALRALRFVFTVPEGWTALLYQHGLYVRRNNPGRHIIWGRGWSVKLVDLRRTLLDVPGNEMLTADNIGVKLHLLVACKIDDPARATHATQNWRHDLTHLAQAALQSLINGIGVAALLEQRQHLDQKLLIQLQSKAGAIGIALQGIEIKQVAFSVRLTRQLVEVTRTRPTAPESQP